MTMKLSNLKDMDKDDLLGLLGLSTAPSTTGQLAAVTGIFAVGVLVGAAAALLLAPKPGRELREELRTRISPAPARLDVPTA
jgi:uncharacterized membrane protein YebE (DUF533 family)